MGIKVDESREMDSASRRTFAKLVERINYGPGAPSAAFTPPAGSQYYDTTDNRLWEYSPVTGWTFVASFDSTKRAGVSLTDAAQTITTATVTDIAWGTEVQDFDGWTSGGSATITVPAGWAGQYTMTFSGNWASSTLGASPFIRILVNGAAQYTNGGPNASGGHTVSASRALVVGDALKCQVFQNSGVNVNVDSIFHLAWLGR